MPQIYRSYIEFVYTVFASISSLPIKTSKKCATEKEAISFASSLGQRLSHRTGDTVWFYTENQVTAQFWERVLNSPHTKQGIEWEATCDRYFHIDSEFGNKYLNFREWMMYLWTKHPSAFQTFPKPNPPIARKIDEPKESPQNRFVSQCLDILVERPEDVEVVKKICNGENAYLTLMTRVSMQYQNAAHIRSEKLRKLASAFDEFRKDVGEMASRNAREEEIKRENAYYQSVYENEMTRYTIRQKEHQTVWTCVVKHFKQFVSTN